MESYWEDITPARAAELLRTSKLNRSLNQNWVATLSRDMRSGHWVETPQGLVLDEQGNLLDGQHRLNAVRRADMTVRFWVTKGVPAKMFRHLDGGRGRSMADRLGIDRYSDATQLAAISRKVFAWQNNQPWNYAKVPTREELQEVIDKEPLLLSAAKFAHGWRARPAPATAGFAWWLFTKVDVEDAAWFMERLRGGTELVENSGVWLVHTYLWRGLTARQLGAEAQVTRQAPSTGRFQKPQLTLAYMILGWNIQRENRAQSRLLIRNPLSNENYPTPR